MSCRAVAALVLAACSATAGSSSAPTRPNVVLILADDLDFDYKQDRLAIMPNLKAMREAGVHLVNHVAAQPVCGPSRSSLLAGRFPHNTGYIINDGTASIAAWTRAENNTLGTWLSAAGYYTSYLGKYVNSMEAHVPAGWSRWNGFSSGAGTYNFCAWRRGCAVWPPSPPADPRLRPALPPSLPRRQCLNVQRAQHHHCAAAL
jgi:arylsulfatase A-like enzyme